MLSIGAGSRSGLDGGGARGIAGALPRGGGSSGGLLGRGLARLSLGGGANLHDFLARGLHLGRDHAHGLGRRDLVEKAVKVDLHIGDGKAEQVVRLVLKREHRRIVRADGRDFLVLVDTLDHQVLERIAAVLFDLLLGGADVDKRIDQAIRTVVHTALGVHLHKARAGALERLHM